MREGLCIVLVLHWDPPVLEDLGSIHHGSGET